ncbi:MAG TPA: sigma-54-dependent Fis family transcriptional regulator [Porphyromonadaceae bacterium]|nr:sigma-54-dependent Fis family transcriptional regulator [Porphyromonadaceae bacterium]
MKPKILIADDEVRIRRVITLLLKDEGFEVMAVENGQEVLDVLLSFRPDVILLDQQMPVLTGVETLEQIKNIRPNQVVIFVTAFGSIALAVDAVKKGAYDFIEKPFDNENLILKVRRAVEHCRMKGEIKNLKNKLKETGSFIVGETGGLKQVIAQVKRVAETNATVLVNGESGTGKELIAHAIHTYSDRSDGAYIAVNCGAIPLSLMENELFGHEKGAFTDAREAQAGTFERANGGTLFLDEIGELPMDAQVKLLRVLEERKITRIGGKKSVPVDVRIVAATNRDLEEEVKKGNFRLDLLYRLNVFTIQIPPLRERKKDISHLVDFFIRKHNKALNLTVQSITRAAMEKIMAYDWPGNVRDLENAIQSAMILTPDGIIQVEHLPLRVKGYEQVDTTAVVETENNGIREINAQIEKEVILEALKKHNYNRTLTAEALNISRKTLFNKMKRYGLDS